jgi:hypothetical protein
MRLFGYEIRKVRNQVDQNGLPYNATCLHPQLKTTIELAFKIGDKEFYTFKNFGDMPIKRHQRLSEFIAETEMRLTGKDLLELTGVTKDALNKGKIVDASVFLSSIENLASQYMETDTYYRLFSCVFFDIDEVITDYDYDYNEAKIELFKSQPQTSFFFQKPMREYLPQTDISAQDLEVFLRATKANKEYIQKIRKDYTSRT